MEFNQELSRAIGKKIRAANKQCYYNAFKALDHLPGAVYVEGYAIVGRGLVIEHGWLEYQGAIVDPTLTEGAALYEPGLRFTAAELGRAIIDIPKTGREDLPIFYRLGWGGSDSPEMMTAYKRALAAVDNLDQSAASSC